MVSSPHINSDKVYIKRVKFFISNSWDYKKKNARLQDERVLDEGFRIDSFT